MPITDETSKKQTVSARVNKLVYDMYKESELPISTIIEAGLIYFLKLDEDKKLEYISKNSPETVEKEELKPLSGKWSDYILNALKKYGVPMALASSIALGSLTLIASGILKSNNED